MYCARFRGSAPSRFQDLKITCAYVDRGAGPNPLTIFGMKLHVECYSAYKAEQRPKLFRIDQQEYRVVEVIDQWYGPQDAWYKLRANDGNIYILRHQTCVPDGAWDLVSFRKAAG